MIETIPQIRAADTFSITTSLILQDHEGFGILRVRVLDRFGVELADVEAQDCPQIFEVDLGTVARTRLPLFVDATDCQGGVTPPDIPILHTEVSVGEPDPRRLPCSAVNCEDDPNCTAASADAQRARNRLALACGLLQSAEARRDRLLALWIGLMVAVAALMAAAAAVVGIPFIGGILSVILLSAALATGALAVSALAQHRRAAARARRAREDTEAARDDFERAVDSVLDACCPHCIFVDLEAPECLSR